MCRFVPPLVILIGLLAPPGRATAGWVTIKNETNQPVVVQETHVVNNQVRRGKPVKLMPGDVLREFQANPGTKTIHVLEGGGQKRTLCRGELSWTTGDQAFAVRRDGTAVKVFDAAAAVR